MSKFPRLSANKIIKILVEDFGFQVSRLTSLWIGTTVTIFLPATDLCKITWLPVWVGTLFGILSLGEIKKEDFLKKLCLKVFFVEDVIGTMPSITLKEDQVISREEITGEEFEILLTVRFLAF